MIHAWRASGHGSITAFPHSTVRYWDLRHFFDVRTYTRKHLAMPSQIIKQLVGRW